MARLTVGDRGISLLGTRVQAEYASINFTVKTATLFSLPLLRRLSNAEILSLLKPTTLELGNLYKLLETLPQQTKALMYVPDRTGVTRPVFVYHRAGWILVSPTDTEVPTWSPGDVLYSKTLLVQI
jgi:hypothetical protein